MRSPAHRSTRLRRAAAGGEDGALYCHGDARRDDRCSAYARTYRLTQSQTTFYGLAVPAIRRLDLCAVAALATTAVLIAVRPPLGPASANGDDLALAVTWCIAVACSVRLSLTSLWCAIALHRNRPEHAQRIARIAPRFVRHAVELAIVSSIVVSVPVAASAQARDEPVVRAPAPPPKAVSVPPPPVIASPRTYVVRPGDNLWSIAQSQVAGHGGGDVAQYWRALVAANRSTLRSKNPNLIFPGEIVALPPQEPLS